jgi:hypothetical protein
MQEEVKHYKVKSLPTQLRANSVYYVKATSQSAVNTYITDQNGFPFPLIDLTGGGNVGVIQSVTGTGVTGTFSNPIINISTFKSSDSGNLIELSANDGKLFVKPITSPDGSIDIVSTASALELQLGVSLQTQIQNALQPGDNISELVNDVGYITLADLPFSAVSATAWTPNHTTATGNPYLAGTIVYYLGHIFQANFNNDSIIPAIGGNLYWTDLGLGYLIDQEQTDWLAVSGSAFIKNKPTNVSSFTNDSGYLTLTTLPPTVTPDLQQVTTVGSTTTDVITVAGIISGNFYSDGYSLGISDNYDTNYNLSYIPYSGLQITDTINSVYLYQDASLGFQTAAGFGNLRTDLVTGSHGWQLPNASGTLALLSDIPTVGTWGALNYPVWTTGTPFVKMTAAGTFALDTNTYLTTTAAALTYYPIPTGTISQYIRGDGSLATFPSTAIPTLQQVTTAGNVTTNTMIIGGGSLPGDTTMFLGTSVQINVLNSTGGYSNVAWLSPTAGLLLKTNSNPGFFSSILKSDLITGTDKTFQFPNNSGTLALLSDIPSGIVTSVTATSPITSSGGATPDISTSMATNKLIGRSTAGTGVMEEITVGTGLSLSGGTLSATATGILHGTASGTDTYTVTITGPTAYNDADAYLIRFTNGNTTGATLNINGLGAIPLYRNNDGPLLGGDILDGGEMLCIYNSTLVEFQVIGISPNSLIAYVTNADSVALTKGMPVYAFGGQVDRMTVKRANNTGDATSAQTVGLVLSTSIAAGQKGVIMMQGLLDGLSILPTATFADGDAVYLGATNGSITNVKPYAPNHLVYLGVVTTASNGSAGRLYVRVQNGYELDELHNVDAHNPNNNDGIFYNSTTQLWEHKNVLAVAAERRNANNSTNNNINYCGIAPADSLESASVWTITRLTVTLAGAVTTANAINVKWTDRETTIYT